MTAMLDLYHHTHPLNAEKIFREKKMDSTYNHGATFFTTHPHSEYASAFGSGIVHVRVPEHIANIDDEFPSGEQHYWIDKKDLKPHHFVDHGEIGHPSVTSSLKNWQIQPKAPEVVGNSFMSDRAEDHMIDRVAVLQGVTDSWLLDDMPVGMKVVAHVSGNQIDILHCPFCGSGAVIGRSDGTVECGYCTSVFTVQVQPAYNGFPQSVDGQPYNWPGMPEDQGTMAPDAPPGTDMGAQMQDPAMAGPPFNGAPGVGDSSDPSAGGDPEDEDDDSADDDDDKPAFLKGKGDKKDDKKKDKKKGDNPFAKKKSYITIAGAELDEDNFVAHLAIQTARDPLKVAQAIKAARARGEL